MLNGFRILFVNELVSILRERVALFWIFFFPFFFMAIMLISYGQQGLFGHQRIEIVDHDRTALSALYIDEVRDTFTSNSVLRAEIVVLDTAHGADAGVRDGTIRVTLPAGFARAFTDAGSTSIHIAYGSSSGLATTIAARIFAVLTTTFNAEAAHVPLRAKLEFVNTTNSKPVGQLQYLLTGILIMSMMTAGMNNACVGIVAQRERNTFKLMSCLPLSPIVYLTSILAARIVILFVAAFVLLLGARHVYRIDMPLSAWQLLNAAGLILVGGTMLLSIGVAMSSRIARVPTAIVLCNVVYMSLLFASDLTMPLASYPDTVRPFLLALPTTQFAAALRAILVQGSDLIAQWRIVASLAAWSLGCLAFSRAAFRWHEV